jgi:glutamate synthase domain-containing protein 1
MMDCMGSRGEDSAGLAVFGKPTALDARQFSLFSDAPFGWEALWRDFRQSHPGDGELQAVENHAVVIAKIESQDFRTWLAEKYPQIHLLSAGRAIRVFKDEGHPRDIAQKYALANSQGTHAVGHTRMATESAVSPAHAHPFTAGEDFCLVHNGSLSNPYSVRRRLEHEGIAFETDNDTEAGCRFLEWRMRQGDSVEQAIQKAFAALDGFFTFLIGTARQLVLVRDAFACKPAVVAESPDYVAVASEFRSLAHLPSIETARVFEPKPQQVYSWTV